MHRLILDVSLLSKYYSYRTNNLKLNNAENFKWNIVAYADTIINSQNDLHMMQYDDLLKLQFILFRA